jgi:hypothetical protein
MTPNMKKQPPPPPTPGSVWKHKNGKHYRVLLIANEQSRVKAHPVSVVYLGPRSRVWCMPLAEWNTQPLTPAQEGYVEDSHERV